MDGKKLLNAILSAQLERVYLTISKIAQFGWEMLENMENIALRRSQILYIFVLHAEKPITLPTISVQMWYACPLSYFTTSQTNLAILLWQYYSLNITLRWSS